MYKAIPSHKWRAVVSEILVSLDGCAEQGTSVRVKEVQLQVSWDVEIRR